MKIIIPMAGRGTRLRPHTLTVPKPLIPVAGKPMVQILVEDLAASYPGDIEEIAYVIGDFGSEVERELIAIAGKLGARGKIYYQDKALGVGHAVYCAADSLNGKCMVAFSDTLFKADFRFNSEEDGVIWTQKVDNPASFGVVQLDTHGYITEFVEKPAAFVSDLAIVGIYYFRESENLRDALRHIIDNDIKDKNEYQLTTALEFLTKRNGVRFQTGAVEEWLDCGTRDNILNTNARMLSLKYPDNHIDQTVHLENAVIVPPCFIDEGAIVRNAVVGPFVSIGAGTVIEHSVITHSIIQNKAIVRNALLDATIAGNFSRYSGAKDQLDLGDYSILSRRQDNSIQP